MVTQQAVVRIDEPNRPSKAAAFEVLGDNRADAAGLGAGAEQGHGRRVEQTVEVANGHDRATGRRMGKQIIAR